MPELPEVEIITRQLDRRLAGQRVRRVEVRDAKLKVPARLAGQIIKKVRRRAKFIIFELSGGEFLLAHLRMTGWFEFNEPAKWRAAIVTGNHTTAYFEDSRRFGVLEVVSANKLAGILGRLGPEPFEHFDLRTSRPVKVALLDQRLVAGLGNIYASESLWRARINPRRRADRLSAGELRRLRRAIGAAMRKAMAYGPRIFEVQQFYVYEREGRPCRRCRTPIRRVVQAQRSTFFCPRCQRR